jgi:alanine racemase
MIGTMLPENFKNVKWKNLAVMVQDKETIKSLGEYGKKVKIHLKVNTGMNRQGVEISEIKGIIKLIKKYPKLILEGVMSHLADADNPNNKETLEQIKKFEEAIEIIEKSGIKLKYCHLGATAGSVKIKNPKINAVRLGIGLYGINNLEKEDRNYKKFKELKPVLSFKTVLTTLRTVKKGERVSYNGIWETKKTTNIGVVSVGYNEGLDRRLSNKGWVKYKGKFCPIIGRVCMNLAIVDLGQTKAKLFDEVEVISNNRQDKNSIENIAEICQTIPYDILVKIDPSIRRVLV